MFERAIALLVHEADTADRMAHQAVDPRDGVELRATAAQLAAAAAALRHLQHLQRPGDE